MPKKKSMRIDSFRKKKDIIDFRSFHILSSETIETTNISEAQALRMVITELVNLFDSLRYLRFSARCACSQFPL